MIHAIRHSRHLCVSLVLVFVGPAIARAADASSNDAATYEKTMNKAVEFLRIQGQAADGSYSAEAGPGVTAVVTTAILRTGRTSDDPLVAKSLKYLEGFVKGDGGIYADNSSHQNYETCLAMQCFAAANRDKRYDALLRNAERYVKGIQWGANDGTERSHPAYGGAGYGRSKRPDLSNTSFLLDALKSVGRGSDDEAVQKALVFVSRCQNLETEYNTTPFASKNPDGGFYYTPAAGGNSQAGATPEGGLRSYASMTYAGLKSMIFAGLAPDDPRVKAARAWLAQHYTLDENPGMGSAGLYYYYQTFARALSTYGEATFVDSAGKKHDWRHDLVTQLARQQKPDGSWVNENARWMEGNPNLVTGYALLALDFCRPKP
ncbi:MAG TPA: prenyltransferase/squalene oxidase repeat-containing protein [Pirellulales bacterium]|jgi:squalene-hopene/tetraprenyl-beta-curcumene cyclase|nr:prenyltransferase/squalene oxidase repeat-containing protein [Pirellulales bacterium]